MNGRDGMTGPGCPTPAKRCYWSEVAAWADIRRLVAIGADYGGGSAHRPYVCGPCSRAHSKTAWHHGHSMRALDKAIRRLPSRRSVTPKQRTKR